MPYFCQNITSAGLTRIAAAPPASPGNTNRARWKILGYQIMARSGGQVADVELQDYNDGTTTGTAIVLAGACGVSGGGVAAPPVGTHTAGYGITTPGNSLQLFVGSGGSPNLDVMVQYEQDN